MSKSNQHWSLIIRPRRNLFRLDLRELWRYRDLIVLFVRRDFVALYKQTVLGPAWYLVQPLLTTLMYYFIFTKVIPIPTDGAPPLIFYLSGVVTWGYFSACVQKTSRSFIDNIHIYGKVYFPRLAVPVGIIISSMISLVIQLGILGLFVVGYMIAGNEAVKPNIWLLSIPLLCFMMAMLGLGFGMIVTAVTTKYRDLAYVVTFGVQLGMYATPVIYPMSVVEGKLKMVLMANPMSSIVETTRYAFLGSGELNVLHLGYSLAFCVVLLAVAVVVFNSVDRTFTDTV